MPLRRVTNLFYKGPYIIWTNYLIILEGKGGQ